MYLKKNVPYVVAAFIIAVGLFFCASSLIDGALLDPEPPNSHLLIIISVTFIIAGIGSIYLLHRGKLEKSGKSIAEVRQQSIEKMRDPALLARIASEDQNPEIRKTAEERLEELKN